MGLCAVDDEGSVRGGAIEGAKGFDVTVSRLEVVAVPTAELAVVLDSVAGNVLLEVVPCDGCVLGAEYVLDGGGSDRLEDDLSISSMLTPEAECEDAEIGVSGSLMLTRLGPNEKSTNLSVFAISSVCDVPC